jgi:alkylation response protein AidB-like acyl-CoA dehydrogenase
MDQLVEDITQHSINWVGRAESLQSIINANAERTESGGRVTDEVMAALHEQQLFRMALPKSVGGGEATPLEIALATEAIAKADASTAWCVGQASGCSWCAAYTPSEVAKEIFEPANAVLAWGPPNSSAQAEKIEGGYNSNGKWRFGSGSLNATWVGGHSFVVDKGGNRVLNENGSPKMRTMLIPKEKITFEGIWDVMGLKGTGSDTYVATDLFVDEAHTTWRDSQPDRNEFGPLYSVPLLTAYGIIFAGLSLGVARSLLEDFKKLASEKPAGGHGKPDGQPAMLRDNAVIQSKTTENEAKLRSARALWIETVEEYWENLVETNNPPLELRARLRMAITWAMLQAREVGNNAFHATGTNGIFEMHPFERRFRDLQAISAQGQSHHSNFEPVGAVLLGIEANSHRF